MRYFEEIEHTADQAFHVKGRDLAALLENAAVAMQSLAGIRFTAKSPATREVELEAVDRESLLVNWLNEILYLEQTYRLACLRFHVYELSNHHLRARIETQSCDQSYTHIKAATFHNLKIWESSCGLEAEVVVDV
jgi:SHS2 domain-containing protein